MHNDYLETFPDFPCSYEMYRKCISAENISFTKLGEEQCEVCLVYYNSHDSKTCKLSEENVNQDEQPQATDAQCNACDGKITLKEYEKPDNCTDKMQTQTGVIIVTTV